MHVEIEPGHGRHVAEAFHEAFTEEREFRHVRGIKSHPAFRASAGRWRGGTAGATFRPMVVSLAVLALGAAWALAAAGVEPFPTWFYVFAWYPTLVLLDADARRRDRRPSIFADPRRLASLGFWSAVIWLVFEAANFRLRNWYYVFVPDRMVERWLGILLSFATVVPAVVLVERWLRALGVGRTWQVRPLRTRRWEMPAIAIMGVGMAAAALAVPEQLFPLIWGAAWLIAEPFVYRRRPDWSLLMDIELGVWGRIGRLLVGGLLIGVVWEFFNSWARGRWIYTVPWLEHTKLFEMPPLGFLGFPFFALEAWAMYHALCAAGLAVPPEEEPPPAPRRRRAVAIAGAAVLSVAVLLGMDRMTISSTTPRIPGIPGVTAAEVLALRDAGYHSVFALADARGSTASAAGVAPSRFAAIVREARLVVLRGIGTGNAADLASVGIASVCELARRNPATLRPLVQEARRGRLGRAAGPVRPTRAEVRVWVGAARRACPQG